MDKNQPQGRATTGAVVRAAPREVVVAATQDGRNPAVLALLRLLLLTLPPGLLHVLPVARTWDLLHYVFLELSVVALFRTLLGLPDPARLLSPPVTVRAPGEAASVATKMTAAEETREDIPVEDEDAVGGKAGDDEAGTPFASDEEVEVPEPPHPLLARVDGLVDKLLGMAKMGDAAQDTEHWEMVCDRGDAVRIWRSKRSQHLYRLLGIFDAPLFTTFDFLNDIEKRPEWDEMTEGTEILERLDNTTRIQHIRVKAIWPTSARDLVLMSHVKKVSDTQLLAVTTSVDHPRAPVKQGVVRMWAECAGQICEKIIVDGQEKTRVLQIADGDPKGWIPQSILTMVATKALPNSFQRINRIVSALPPQETCKALNRMKAASKRMSPASSSTKLRRRRRAADPSANSMEANGLPHPAAASSSSAAGANGAMSGAHTPSNGGAATPTTHQPPPGQEMSVARRVNAALSRPGWPLRLLRAAHRAVTKASPWVVSAMFVMMVWQRVRHPQATGLRKLFPGFPSVLSRFFGRGGGAGANAAAAP